MVIGDSGTGGNEPMRLITPAVVSIASLAPSGPTTHVPLWRSWWMSAAPVFFHKWRACRPIVLWENQTRLAQEKIDAEGNLVSSEASLNEIGAPVNGIVAAKRLSRRPGTQISKPYWTQRTAWLLLPPSSGFDNRKLFKSY